MTNEEYAITKERENAMTLPHRNKESEASNASKLDVFACLIIVVFMIFLAWFGAEFHYVELCYATEYDRYVEKADQLRQGILPADHYHGLFYPLLAAAMGILMGDTFAGARTVSTLAAGGLLSLTYLLGARCFDRKVALLATLALALNSLVVTCGLETATDMLSALLGLACLLLSMKLSERPNTRTIIGLGVCFSLAYFTRYTAVAALPCLFLALWLCPFPSNRRRLLGAITLASTVLVCLLPHFALNTYMFGGPFNTRAVDSLSTKLASYAGDAFVSGPGVTNMTNLMMTQPGLVCMSFFQSLREWMVDGYIGWVAGNHLFLASALFTVALLGGVIASLMRVDRRVSLLLLYMITYFIIMCVFLVTMQRFFLPILPLCMLIAVRFMTEELPDEGYLLKGVRVTKQILALVLFLALLPVGAFQAMADMIPRHPYQELAAAKRLEIEAGKNIVVAGTFPFFQRYVGYRYHHLSSDFGNKGPQEVMDYFRKLGLTLKENKADYIIVGSCSLGSRPRELLTGQGLPDYFQPEVLKRDLAVYRVLKDRL
jgi:4-amino-4-deoxy-L-arabinose transferase-like glycosyltransferase